MIILTISLLAGGIAASVLYATFTVLGSLELERRFRERYNNARGVQKKGITGNLLFIASKLGAFVKNHPHKRMDALAAEIRFNLSILGEQYRGFDPHTFIGIQILAGLTAILLAIVLLDIYNVVLLAVAGVLGFAVPLFLIKDKVKARHKAIFRQLPDILDMLTLMVEAGLDFNAALNKVLQLEKGPLVDELSMAQQEVKLGKSREEALGTMSERVHYIPLNTVINSIILALKTGGSLAPALRSLSDQFRTERAQLAEKMAGEAPIKLMAPLVLLIFPTIFIILFGPVLLTFMNG